MLLSVVVLVIQLAGTHAIAHRSGPSHHSTWWATGAGSSLDWGAYLLLFVGPVALLAKRAYPRCVLAVVFSATAAYALIGYPGGPVFLSLVIAFAVVVNRGHRAVGIGCIVLGWALFLWLPSLIGTGTTPSATDAVELAAWLLTLLAVAEAVRNRRERMTAVRRSRSERGLRQAEEERLRIARELHDVLAHNISLINVQSGVALHLLDERPEQARTALTVINEASADALREIRSVLGVLRHVDEQAPRRPAASLERLPELISRSAAAGLEVEMRIDGEPRPLPSDVDLAAYRILQESLTNVTRHARTGQARVSVRYEDRALALEVDDEGDSDADADAGLLADRDPVACAEADLPAGPVARAEPRTVRAGPGTGNGIVGMRERVAALGGEFRAGPRPGGGFRVSARLPLGDSA